MWLGTLREVTGSSLHHHDIGRHRHLPLIGRARDGGRAQQPRSLILHRCSAAGWSAGLHGHVFLPRVGDRTGRADAALSLLDGSVAVAVALSSGHASRVTGVEPAARLRIADRSNAAILLIVSERLAGREVVALGRAEAHELGFSHVGTEALLLGLGGDGGASARVLRLHDRTGAHTGRAVGQLRRRRSPARRASLHAASYGRARGGVGESLRRGGFGALGSEHILLGMAVSTKAWR